MEKLLESSTVIRFPDCDPFNHLNNSKYIDYMINAREDQLRDYYDLDVYQIVKKRGIGWVVSQNQVTYFRPALLMEKVVIQSQLFHYNEKELYVEATMWNEDKTVLKSLYWAKLVHYNLATQKSEVHSADFMDLFKEVVLPLDVTTFDQRTQQLYAMQKTMKAA